ncbi:hypothetical protein BOTBODRAFT_137398 [Botryobasidium botryosum FD-172 SS1]|uniref:Methyltransferase domain-containing protein n=1 Tax=Botryobasidium botryosum (strain FD-172 SS1) TaxID=930990 RepID=A0A067M5D3_BOTB1|nr:hypothetical protein BOTBODRAFT_137398 [Botryobasidium botryosum FD-172 SS1]
MSGNLNKSMRENYSTHGVDQYYKIVSKSYRNVHDPGIKKCLAVWLDAWWAHYDSSILDVDGNKKAVCVLDMAAGSGEVTVAIKQWWDLARAKFDAQTPPSPAPAPTVTATSPPPPVPIARPVPVARPGIPRNRQASSAVIGPDAPALIISATDPYTVDAYVARTGLPCHPLSFRDIADGSLPPLTNTADKDTIPASDESQDSGNGDERDDLIYEMVVCSFALHLIESTSELWALLTALSEKVRWLVILEPHKKPEIKDGWGWNLWDTKEWCAADHARTFVQSEGSELEIVRERVRCRIYRSVKW